MSADADREKVQPGKAAVMLSIIALVAGVIWYSIALAPLCAQAVFRFSLVIAAVAAITVSLGPLRRFLLSAPVAFTIAYALILAALLRRFGPDLSSYIWHIDGIMLYYQAVKGMEAILHGGLFGWDPAMLGGVPSFFSCNFNLALLAAPFMALFGARTGFNLFALATVAAYPICVYSCARAWLPNNREAAAWSIYLAAMWMFYYFKVALQSPLWNSMAGIDLYVLVLIFSKGFFEGRRLSGFYLALSISLSCYAHLSAFALSLLTVVVLFLLFPCRGKNLFRISLLFLIVFLVTLPYGWYFLIYGDYFIEDGSNFIPAQAPFSPALGAAAAVKAVRETFLPPPISGTTVVKVLKLFRICFLPAVICAFALTRLRGLRTLILAYFALCLIVYAGMPFTELAFWRMLFAVPVFPALIFAALAGTDWCGNGNARKVSRAVFAVVIAVFMIGYYPAYRTWGVKRIGKLGDYSGALADKVRGLDGNIVLMESLGEQNYAGGSAMGKRSDRVMDPNVQYAGLFALETGKRFFSYEAEGYHRSIYRANSIISGTYRGKFLSEYGPGTFRSLFMKWGIRYLVLVSPDARAYFEAQPDSYKKVWEIDPEELERAGFQPVRWAIYEFLDADPRSVAMREGSGVIDYEGPFRAAVRLRGAREGETVVVRTNYFPAWRAYWKGKEIPLFDEDGQLALLAPADGDVVIYLYYPKYAAVSLLAILSLGICFLLSRKGLI